MRVFTMRFPIGLGAVVLALVASLALPPTGEAQQNQEGQQTPEAQADPGADADARPSASEARASDDGDSEEPGPPTFDWDTTDPRIGLESGWLDAESAARNIELIATLPRPEGFFNPETPRQGAGFSNTDLAFQGDYLFQGNYNGWLAYDISDPTEPRLEVEVICPGGQGDVSVYGDLLFMSAQETRGRLDCGTQGVQDSVSTERFRGVRIFDISELRAPRQVAAVQTCRGSHTHTLVTDPNDEENVYIYVSGTSSVRPAEEMPGCSAADPNEDPNTSLFQIEVIRVPVDAPEEARIVNMPRLFADRETGDIAGLWEGGRHGEGTQETRRTDRCHDITVFPARGIAAGACSGNGILIDISDPANPVRIDEVVDPNFAYWHSATFNHDASKILFTDEWGGGGQARCRATDPPTWGADAIFEIRGSGDNAEMALAGYYKLPVPQTETENCVAHNGSIIPVPGRDLMVQAWYQGGLSILDFTDPENPYEIAFFDRGPLSDEELHTGGYWSTYWYDGHVFGAEITRGIDVFRLTPSEHLSENEIAAAELVSMGRFNAQLQPAVDWPASPVVARAYLDQLDRNDGIQPVLQRRIDAVLDAAESTPTQATARAVMDAARVLMTNAREVAGGDRLGDADRQRQLAEALQELALSMQ